MAGLSFNPFQGLDPNKSVFPNMEPGQDSYKVPEVSDEYYTPKKVSFFDVNNPQQIGAKIIDEEEEKKKSSPFYSKENFDKEVALEKAAIKKYSLDSVNKWDSGYEGLSAEDKNRWDMENPKWKDSSVEQKNRVWRNQRFFEDFGEEAFYSTPSEERDKIYRDNLLKNATLLKFKNDNNLDAIMSLTPEGQKQLLESDYIPSDQIKQMKEEESNKELEDLDTKDKMALRRYEAKNKAASGLGIGGGIGVFGGFAGFALGSAIGAATGALEGIASPNIIGKKAVASELANMRKENNEEILNKVRATDNNRLSESKELNDRAAEYASAWLQAMATGELSEEAVNNAWNNLALNRTDETIDEFNNKVSRKHTGSNYYTVFKDTDEFANFNTKEKIKELAKIQAVSEMYGENKAMDVLEQDMQDYVSSKQSKLDWTFNALNNVGHGGVANLALSALGLGALSAYAIYGEEGLANFLRGKDASGNGEDNWLISNMEYWDKVDHYNTWSPTKQKFFDENGGVSQHNNILKAGTENDILSNIGNNALEMAKMIKFAWSDKLKADALGKLLGGLTSVTSKASKPLAEGINWLGQRGIILGSSTGIDAAYGLQTFTDVLQENNARLDKIIAQETAQEMEELVKNPRVKEAFEVQVEKENERRKKEAGEKGNWFPVNKEQAWDDYIYQLGESIKQKREKAHEGDRQEAVNSAANSYAIDATIEAVRMAPVNLSFRSWLFDKGTVNSIKNNHPYVPTEYKNGKYAVRQRSNMEIARNALMEQLWGGFQSNYYDDVTVGLAKEFGIQDYNNYLLEKYNPAAYGAILDDYVSPFMAAVSGAGDAALSKRAFLDGLIGAGGGPISLVARTGRAASIAETSKFIKENKDNLSEDMQGLSWAETAWIDNPIIAAIAEARRSARLTEAELNRANETIKRNGDAFSDIVGTVSGLNRRAITRLGEDLLKAEDEKDRQLINLATAMLSLKNNYGVMNAKEAATEEEKKHMSLKERAKAIGRNINAFLNENIFEETPTVGFARALQTLEDAASIEEGANSEEQALRQQTLIGTFFESPDNKAYVESNFKERADKVQFAKERLAKNAKSMLEMMDTIEKLQKKHSSSMFSNQFPELQQQIIFQHALDSRFKTRRYDLEEDIAGKESRDRLENEGEAQSNLTAKYGTEKGLEKVIDKQEKLIKDKKEEIENTKIKLKRTDNRKKIIQLNLQLKNLKDSLETLISKKKAMEREKDLPVGKTVKAEDILKLRADERWKMLDPFHKNDFSAEQKEEIEKAYTLLGEKGLLPDMLQKVKDAAVLQVRFVDYMATAKMILKNPLEASVMVQLLKAERAGKIMEYFKDKVIREKYSPISNEERDLKQEDIEKEIGGYSSVVLKGLSEMAKSDNNISDARQKDITDAVGAVLKTREENAKNLQDVKSYVSKTDKVPVTTNVAKPAGDSVIMEEVTEDSDINAGEKAFINDLFDYASKEGKNFEEVVNTDMSNSEGFEKYVEEINNSRPLNNRTVLPTKERRTALTKSLLIAYNKHAEEVEKAKQPIETSEQSNIFGTVVKIEETPQEKEAKEEKVTEGPEVAEKDENVDKEGKADKAEEKQNKDIPESKEEVLPSNPTILETIDLNAWYTMKDGAPKYPAMYNFVEKYHIADFLSKVAKIFRDKSKLMESLKQKKVEFLYDADLVKKSEESGFKVSRGINDPIIMALRLDEDTINSLGLNKEELISMELFEGGKKTTVYYQPLGFLPSSENTEHMASGILASTFRSNIDYTREGVQIIRRDGRGQIPFGMGLIINGGNKISSTGKSDVISLADNSLDSPTESIINNATSAEKEEYLKKSRLERLLTDLHRRIARAFISNLKFDEDSQENKNLYYRVVKGGNNNSNDRGTLVRRKPISETLISHPVENMSEDATVVEALNNLNIPEDAPLKDVENALGFNSRIQRLFISLYKGIGDIIEGNKWGDEEISKIKNKINDYLYLKGDVTIEDVHPEESPLHQISLKVGDNAVSTLNLTEGYKTNPADIASFIKYLILDENGKVRKIGKEEAVMWQIPYTEIEKAQQAIANENYRSEALRNVMDLYSDGVWEMQSNSLNNPVTTVQITVGNSLKQFAQNSRETGSSLSADQHASPEGVVNPDTGTVSQPAEEAPEFANPTHKQEVEDAIKKIINSPMTLTDDEKHYQDEGGNLWTRISSIKSAIRALVDRFSPNSPWATPSTTIGDGFDAFCRDLFNNLIPDTEEERRNFFEAYPNATVADYEKARKKILDIMQTSLKGWEPVATIVEENGRKVAKSITTKVILNVKDSKNPSANQQVRVAGTIDLLLINSRGDLAVLDFKTHHSETFTEEDAKKKGYDIQLSIYAKGLEEDINSILGWEADAAKVTKLFILPCGVSYPKPEGDGGTATYRRDGNQLYIKRDSNSKEEMFTSANYKVEDLIPMTRLSDDALIAELEHMTDEEKKALIDVAKEQGNESLGQAEAEDIKVEVSKQKKEDSFSDARQSDTEAMDLLSSLLEDTNTEDNSQIAEDIDPDNSDKAIEERNKKCDEVPKS